MSDSKTETKKAASDMEAKAEATVKETQKTVKKSVDASVDAMTQGYDKLVSASREQLEKVMPEAGKNFDEAAKAGKANMDAWVKANEILVKGMEKIGQEVTDFSKSASETQMDAAKKLMAVKTVEEAVELQTGWARKYFDTVMSETSKISEMYVKVANETVEPIQARVSATVSKVSKAA